MFRSIFLSASIPIEGRDQKYYNSADVTAIRDAVIVLVEICLKHQIKIIWGGHPAITPLVYQVIKQYLDKSDSINYYETDKKVVQKYVHIFQSDWYKDKFPKDNEFFENIIFTPKGNNQSESLKIMRKAMMKADEFYAGIFIGGMEGVEDEYKIFCEANPQAKVLPIASTGAAASIIYESDAKTKQFEADLLTNYAYNSLFSKYILQ